MQNEDKSRSVGIRRKNSFWRFFTTASDILHGRVGMPVCLKGRRETLYPKMNKREVRRVADEICRWAAEPPKAI